MVPPPWALLVLVLALVLGTLVVVV